MNKFKINADSEKISSVNRTVRFKPFAYEKLTHLSEKYNISFNKVVNQCIDFALENLEED